MEVLDQELFETPVQQYFEASKNKRITNQIIDYFLYLGLTFGLGVVIATLLIAAGEGELIQTMDEESLSFRFFDYLFSAVVMLFYYTLLEYYTKGKTLGKLITKTRAVQRSGEPMTFGIAFKRSACRLIPFNAFSFLGDLKNGWHDSIPGTKVIDENLPLIYTKPNPVVEELPVNPAEEF